MVSESETDLGIQPEGPVEWRTTAAPCHHEPVHEVSLVSGFLEAALAAAQQDGATSISRITVEVGALANLTDDSLRFNFEILSSGTVAADADVIIRREPGHVTCRDCGGENPMGPEPICPACGSVRIEVKGSHHCYLESIDVGDAKSASA